jgi:hypothetical protein
MSVVRTDTAIVGTITDQVFSLALYDVGRPELLLWSCLQATSNGTYIVFGAGLFGDGLQGIINETIRPAYFKLTQPVSVSGVDSNSRTNLTLAVYYDVYGSSLAGYLHSSSLLVSRTVQPSSYQVTNLRPTGTLDVVTGIPYYNIRYVQGSTLTAVKASLYGCFNLDGQLTGICDGFNESTVTQVDITPYYINFVPVNFYSEPYCSTEDDIIGYLPAGVIATQCVAAIQVPFGSSDYCRNQVIRGFSQKDRCGDIGFQYYYGQDVRPGLSCGTEYSFRDNYNQVVEVKSSYGTCDNNLTCSWIDPLFECVDNPNLKRAPQQPNPKIEQPVTQSSAWILTGSVLIVLSIILIVVVLIIVWLSSQSTKGSNERAA